MIFTMINILFVPVSNLSSGPVCVKVLGHAGGEWPTPQRGHWFPREGDIATFREKMVDLCPLEEVREAKDYFYGFVGYECCIAQDEEIQNGHISARPFTVLLCIHLTYTLHSPLENLPMKKKRLD